jgi:hypothetical protein
MNFLSHFYHELPTNDPYLVAGVIMPDILSNYTKRYGERVRLHPAKLKESEQPELASLYKGVQQHYFVDKHFHDSAYFDESTDWIERRALELDFKCFDRRLFAFSHIFLELMMDRVILLSEPKVCDAMYQLLEQAEIGVVSDFFKWQNVTSSPDKVSEHLHTFVQRKFVYHYADDQRLIMILDSMNTGFGNPPCNENDKTHLTTLIHDTEATLLLKKFPTFHGES